jgi:branched-chain amino acid transport system substrate-binding protein
MKLSRRGFNTAAIAAMAQVAAPVFAQSQKIKIGVLTDMSGALSAVLGMGSVDGARMAIEDFGKTVAGMPIELVFADHQNKPDIGSATARRWFDEEQVDLLLDLGSSGVAIACQTIARDKNKVIIVTGASSSDITNKFCNSNSFHWGYDTYMQSAALASDMTKRGGDTWFFITADYAFGHSLEADATQKILARGGKVLGSAKHPANTLDMSSLLLQAQTSGAQTWSASSNKGMNSVSGGARRRQLSPCRCTTSQLLASSRCRACCTTRSTTGIATRRPAISVAASGSATVNRQPKHTPSTTALRPSI